MEMEMEMDEQPELEAPEAQPTQLYEFEGAVVSACEGKLPPIVLDMPEGFVRDTHLRMLVEVRVRSIRYEENRAGELIRQHVFALDSVQLVAAFRPGEARDDVAGSASTAPTQTPEEATELGLEIGRTGRLWAAS
jgi:hypothetical protein